MIEQSEWNSVKNHVENKLKCPKTGKNNNMSCVIKFNTDFFLLIVGILCQNVDIFAKVIEKGRIQ